ncbi:MAG: MASE2 domain-containing protein, partial [Gammaproteobacteria bacterium]
MKQTQKRKLHPIIMLVYIPRTIGYLFVFAMITSVMYGRDYSITLWIFLILQCFLWPHILFLISSYSKKPKLVEFWFLSADSFFFGVWLAIINFNPWVVMVLLVTSMMGNMSLYGISLCLRCLVGLILGALISGFFTDYQFILNSSKVTIITCAMSIFIYCVVTAIVIYSRGEQLRNIKKSLAVANEKITQFDKIVKAASSNLEFNSVMETIIPVLRNTFNFDTMAIQLADEEQKKLYFFAIYGRYITQRYLNEMASIEVSLQQNDSISYTVYVDQEPIYFARVTNDMEKLKKDKEIFEIKPFLSLLSIPIVIKSKSIGVINFMSHYAYSNLNHEQLETVQQLVSQMSMIIYTAVQFQKKQQRIDEINA